MGSRKRGVTLWRVDDVKVGSRHRRDLGDIDALAASVCQLGLLQPLTVTPDRFLVLCGARRLAAVKVLGWDRVPVRVCEVSTRLHMLLAELHENAARKPLAPTEAARLYREAKAVLAADAANRQRATRFGARNRGPGGAAVSAQPASGLGVGTARAQAAQFVTGHKSHTRLEQVVELIDLVDSAQTPYEIHQLVGDALAEIDRTGKVAGPYNRVKAAITNHTATHDQAPSGTTEPGPDDGPGRGDGRDRSNGRGPAGRSLRQHGLEGFLSAMADLNRWTEDYDPVEIGRALTDSHWAELEAVVTATTAFADAARTARAPDQLVRARSHRAQ